MALSHTHYRAPIRIQFADNPALTPTLDKQLQLKVQIGQIWREFHRGVPGEPGFIEHPNGDIPEVHEAIVQLLSDGVHPQTVADLYELTYRRVMQIRSNEFPDLPIASRSKVRVTEEQKAEIWRLFDGLKLSRRAISRTTGVSTERVNAIVKARLEAGRTQTQTQTQARVPEELAEPESARPETNLPESELSEPKSVESQTHEPVGYGSSTNPPATTPDDDVWSVETKPLIMGILNDGREAVV